MKTKNFTKKAFLLLLFISIFISCSDNEATNETLTVSEISAFLNVDDITGAVDDLLDQDETDDPFAKLTQSSIANCVIRTVEELNNQRIVTLDFGDGCTPNNGREFSGMIRIVYTMSSGSISKDVSFIDFYVNSVSIEGFRNFSATRQNSNGNTETSIVVDVTLTFPNSISISRTGTKIREKIEGNNTDTRLDDVFSITGNWQTIDRTSLVRTAVVQRPLIRKFNCRYFVSGVLRLSRGDATATINFGDGECDNLALVTGPNGGEFQIEL